MQQTLFLRKASPEVVSLVAFSIQKRNSLAKRAVLIAVVNGSARSTAAQRNTIGAFTRTFFSDPFARHTPARHAFGVACRNVGRSALLLAARRSYPSLLRDREFGLPFLRRLHMLFPGTSAVLYCVLPVPCLLSICETMGKTRSRYT